MTFSTDSTLAIDAIVAFAAHAPSAVALEQQDARRDYASLIAAADALASRLAAAGVKPGAVVAVCLPRGIAQVTALLAAWRVGAAYCPLDPAWPEARLEALVADLAAAAIVTAIDGIAGATPVVPPEGEAVAGFAPVAAARDDIAYVIFTSGSTGKPKAVEVTHANLAALVAWHNDAFEVRAGTRTSHLAGLGFDASAWEVWPTLAAGGTLALVDDATRLDAAALRDWLVTHNIKVAFAPTALAEPMVAMDWPADTSLRVLLTGADKLTVRPKAGQPFVFVNDYGPTESTVVATSGVVAPDGDGLPPIGRAIAGTTIYLLDAEGQPVPDGAEGEIWIGGAQVARGYRGDPALTAARFVTHPEHGRLYRTGDLGALLPSGEIAFRGRVDSQVKVRGHRIEPAEIAAELNKLASVETSAVVLRDGELVAYVVPAGAISASELRAALAGVLPDYMVPSRFARLPALPLNASGKLDAAALPNPLACALDDDPAPQRAPASPTEARLLDIVRAVIGRDDIGVDDDFFQMGGHSLLGTQVVVRARDAFGVELTLFHLFEGRTAAKLATTIEGLVMEKLAGLSDEDLQRMAG
ncbi:non-ribosomal peptide synthetase [Hephaestia mangrovi]|uniref:non-ribosomal peptide synthetase n=1 Tax=Hephaestia mangrovi TaxID=2873268 RepID=UPI001CA731AF|nr:non-ribosomal peptide synthetase [Hephaestia mangrovi]MBY8828993.1 non-ribosomal peptide synthetase [Hephaestia mangrovi]